MFSTLSSILESTVSERYFLSPTACAGILRRSEKRGRVLPEHLREALQAAAGGAPGPTKPQRGKASRGR
jgi:hypothetical protein